MQLRSAFFWDVNTSILEKRPLNCFKTSGTNHPGTRSHIPEKLRPSHSSNTSVGPTLCHRIGYVFWMHMRYRWNRLPCYFLIYRKWVSQERAMCRINCQKQHIVTSSMIFCGRYVFYICSVYINLSIVTGMCMCMCMCVCVYIYFLESC